MCKKENFQIFWSIFEGKCTIFRTFRELWMKRGKFSDHPTNRISGGQILGSPAQRFVRWSKNFGVPKKGTNLGRTDFEKFVLTMRSTDFDHEILIYPPQSTDFDTKVLTLKRKY